MEVALLEAAAMAASPRIRMRCTSLLRNSKAASSPQKRARSSPRDAENPATTRDEAKRGRRESAPRVGSPRDAENPATTRDEAKRGRRESEPRVGSPAEWPERVRSSLVDGLEAETPQKKARIARPKAGEALAPQSLDPERYGPDLWTAVAKHMCKNELLHLSWTSSWLYRFVSDDSIWRDAFIRALGLPNTATLHTPRPPHRSWRQLYCSTLSGSHAFLSSKKELRGWRVGGFILDTPEVILTSTVPLPLICTDDVHHAITTSGACVLTNARIGIWIADMQITSCSGCHIRRCRGMFQILEARHTDLLPEETLKYEKLGDKCMHGEVPSALCAILNSHHITSQSTASLLNFKSWIAERDVGEPKTSSTKHAVAVHSNLQSIKGLRTVFLAARDSEDQQQIVAIKIVQLLY